MVTLDGIDYDVSTAAENTNDLITYINQYCVDNNISNSEGEVIQIEATDANPLYLLCYGVGYLSSTIQQLIYNIGCMFNLQAASDRQIISIAQLAGMSRRDATYTTVTATVIASSTAPCVITRSLTATVNLSGTTLTFNPAFEVTIPASTSGTIVLICTQTGAYSLPENSITSFDTNPDGFSSMTSEASAPGSDIETMASLRQRVRERGETNTMLDRAAAAITELAGVSKCSIYFNYSSDQVTVVNTTDLAPRTAMLFVQGYNDQIAGTFYKYLTCLTQQDAEGTYIQQDYITNAGQHIPVYIIPPVSKPVYIRLYVSATLDAEEQTTLKNAILNLATDQEIAGSLSSATIITASQEAIGSSSYSIIGAQVSLTQGQDFSLYVTPSPFELITFVSDNIEILVQS